MVDFCKSVCQVCRRAFSSSLNALCPFELSPCGWLGSLSRDRSCANSPLFLSKGVFSSLGFAAAAMLGAQRGLGLWSLVAVGYAGWGLTYFVLQQAF